MTGYEAAFEHEFEEEGKQAQPELVKKIQQAGRACHVDDIRGEADETRARHRREWLNTRHSCAMPERSEPAPAAKLAETQPNAVITIACG